MSSQVLVSLKLESGKRKKKTKKVTFEELQAILHSNPFLNLTPSVLYSSSSPPILRLFLAKTKSTTLHLMSNTFSFQRSGIVICSSSRVTSVNRFCDSPLHSVVWRGSHCGDTLKNSGRWIQMSHRAYQDR